MLDKLGYQMMAVVFTRPKKTGKIYISADGLEDYIPNDGEIEQPHGCVVFKMGAYASN